jgi:hypothetical protein
MNDFGGGQGITAVAGQADTPYLDQTAVIDRRYSSVRLRRSFNLFGGPDRRNTRFIFSYPRR